jgi:hypothetical protein
MRKIFDEELYKSKPINDLILFSIYFITEKKKKCTFENLTKECFSLFPKVFSFSKYQKWPDSRKIDRPLRGLRNKKLIKGNPKTFFSLTKTGRKAAIQISRIFRQRKLKI